LAIVTTLGLGQGQRQTEVDTANDQGYTALTLAMQQVHAAVVDALRLEKRC